MRRFLGLPLLAVAAILLLAPAQLRADGLDNFTFTETTVDNSFSMVMTWQLPSSPTPDSAISGQGFEFFTVSTSEILNGVNLGTQVADMAFLNPNASPFQFFEITSIGQGSLAFSSMIYTGDETAPTFQLGTYNGFDVGNTDLSGNPATASLSVSAPEPSSILMLLIGFLAFAGALALKKAAA